MREGNGREEKTEDKKKRIEYKANENKAEE
jgi:hypothetical protein